MFSLLLLVATGLSQAAVTPTSHYTEQGECQVCM